MPTFAYSARTREGKRVDGSLEAADRRAALAQLERLGQVPVSVKESAAAAAAPAAQNGKKELASPRAGMQKRMRTREVLTFTTELSDLLASGMQLSQSLSLLSRRKTGRAGDRIIPALREDIVQGASLSEAMEKHPETFPSLYVSLIHAGEASGALPEVLKRLVSHYERMQEVKEKVITALVYPSIVVFVGIVVVSILMVKVIPQFEVVFQDIEGSMPWTTALLLGISRGMVRYGWILIVAAFFGGTAFLRLLASDKGRLWWDGLLLRMPIVNRIVSANAFSQFSRTLGTLLTNGVHVLQALTIVEKTVSNSVLAREVRNAKERVTDGTSISGPLAAGNVFPSLMTDMLAVGEQTGDITKSLEHIAKRYESELDRSIRVLTTLLEPILLIFIAAIVGFVALSIFMAVQQMTSGLAA